MAFNSSLKNIFNNGLVKSKFEICQITRPHLYICHNGFKKEKLLDNLSGLIQKRWKRNPFSESDEIIYNKRNLVHEFQVVPEKWNRKQKKWFVDAPLSSETRCLETGGSKKQNLSKQISGSDRLNFSTFVTNEEEVLLSKNISQKYQNEESKREPKNSQKKLKGKRHKRKSNALSVAPINKAGLLYGILPNGKNLFFYKRILLEKGMSKYRKDPRSIEEDVILCSSKKICHEEKLSPCFSNMPSSAGDHPKSHKKPSYEEDLQAAKVKKSKFEKNVSKQTENLYICRTVSLENAPSTDVEKLSNITSKRIRKISGLSETNSVPIKDPLCNNLNCVKSMQSIIPTKASVLDFSSESLHVKESPLTDFKHRMCVKGEQSKRTFSANNVDNSPNTHLADDASSIQLKNAICAKDPQSTNSIKACIRDYHPEIAPAADSSSMNPKNLICIKAIQLKTSTNIDDIFSPDNSLFGDQTSPRNNEKYICVKGRQSNVPIMASIVDYSPNPLCKDSRKLMCCKNTQSIPLKAGIVENSPDCQQRISTTPLNTRPPQNRRKGDDSLSSCLNKYCSKYVESPKHCPQLHSCEKNELPSYCTRQENEESASYCTQRGNRNTSKCCRKRRNYKKKKSGRNCCTDNEDRSAKESQPCSDLCSPKCTEAECDLESVKESLKDIVLRITASINQSQAKYFTKCYEDEEVMKNPGKHILKQFSTSKKNKRDTSSKRKNIQESAENKSSEKDKDCKTNKSVPVKTCNGKLYKGLNIEKNWKCNLENEFTLNSSKTNKLEQITDKEKSDTLIKSKMLNAKDSIKDVTLSDTDALNRIIRMGAFGEVVNEQPNTKVRTKTFPNMKRDIKEGKDSNDKTSFLASKKETFKTEILKKKENPQVNKTRQSEKSIGEDNAANDKLKHFGRYCSKSKDIEKNNPKVKRKDAVVPSIKKLHDKICEAEECKPVINIIETSKTVISKPEMSYSLISKENNFSSKVMKNDVEIPLRVSKRRKNKLKRSLSLYFYL